MAASQTKPDRSSGAPAPARHVFVLSGPSGVGKTTIVRRLVNEAPVKLIKAISATTRPPRAGEVNGRDYYFLTPEDFNRRRERGELVECQEVHRSGYWYGTLKSEMQRAADAGGWAFLEIDVRGALQVMEQYPEALTIFLKTPSLDEYEQRLRQRGTDPEEVIQRRLQTAHMELGHADQYQHVVINDDLDRAVHEICRILQSTESSTHAG